jgi:hypothetical protein
MADGTPYNVPRLQRLLRGTVTGCTIENTRDRFCLELADGKRFPFSFRDLNGNIRIEAGEG